MAEFFHLSVGMAELVIGGHVTLGATTYAVVWVRNRKASKRQPGRHRAA